MTSAKFVSQSNAQKNAVKLLQIGNYRVIILFMAERKCDFPILVTRSNGRSTCPDKFFKDFRGKGNCDRCPKVNHGQMVLNVDRKGEIDAYSVKQEGLSESLRRSQD